MAFRTFLTASGLLDRNQPPPHGQGPTLHVLALMSSYHGDTLGSMDCAAPSVFNGILEAPWYGCCVHSLHTGQRLYMLVNTLKNQ